MKRFLKAGLVLALIGTGVVSQAATELVIATVNNGHMIEMLFFFKQKTAYEITV